MTYKTRKMNKKGLDDIRQSAQCWADKFKSDLAPDDRAMPTTPLEAYARASWCAEMRVVELCTALLEDGPPSTEKAQNTMAAITTSLYHVQFDGQSYYVEAPTFALAIEAWQRHVQDEWGDDYTGTEQPESVTLVHDNPVIR